MNCFRLTMRVGGRHAIGIYLAIAIAQQSIAEQPLPGEVSFLRWAEPRALPIATVEPERDVADLRPLAAVIGTAHIVALGEPTHGAHEPLAFRNRLFQYLVEELGFTAIAIETGLTESRRIQELVAGGTGDAEQIVRDHLTWGFGAFQENAALVRWMQAYNSDPTHQRKLRFYGLDLSLGGPTGSTPTPVPLEAALSYLDRVDSKSAQRLRSTLNPLLSRLPGPESESFSPAEHDVMSATIDDLIALLERERLAFHTSAGEFDHEWAHRNAIVGRQADRVFRVTPPAGPGGGMPPSAWRAISARDAAMADNVRWILNQEGPAGRVLVFAHNAHVKNASTEGGDWIGLERPPNAMGQYLRADLGEDLVIIGTSSAVNADGLPAAPLNASSVDAVLARVGPSKFLLDLRPSRAEPAVTDWLAEPRELRSNFTTMMILSPGTAFDAILFVDQLTPAHAASPSP